MKKNKKFNPELLKEELKRFKMLETYDFYHEEKEAIEYEKPLLLGDIEEADEANPTDDIAKELGVDSVEEPATDEPATDEPAAEEPAAEEPVGEMPEPEAEMEEPEAEMEEPNTDEVEIDVTSLVKSSEEAKESAERATQNSEMLLQKLTDLESRLSKMDAVSSKIEELEKEIVKRNPTPVEKLEMRSLDSFPYSQKLSDYWNEKEGAYDVMNNKEKEEEYVLTKDDVDQSYSEPQIKKSFSSSVNDF